MSPKSMFDVPAPTLLTWVNEVRIWAGWVAAAAAVTAGLAGYAQIRLQSTVGREKDEALATFKAESAERTALAQAEAAVASARAASIEKETAQLNLALEQERFQRLKLQNEMAWRRITPVQRQNIIEELKGRSFEVWVSTVGTDPEASLFHQQIFDTLKEAGLNPKWFNGYERALGLTISNEEGPERETLIRAFGAAGMTLVSKSGFGMPGLEITVGTKPEPIISP